MAVLNPPPWNVEQIVQAAREALDDLPGDVVDAADEDWKSNDDGLLWSNDELARWADEAQFELAQRRNIKDNTTAAVCEIAFAANDQTKAYHVSILAIEDAYFVETADPTQLHPLVKRTHAEMRQQRPTWRLDEAGDPCEYIEDLSERSITLYRKPDVAGTLYLTVRRLPIRRLAWSSRSSMLEVAAEHQYALLDWIQYKAFQKDDIETRDEKRAEMHLVAFTDAIGVRPSAQRRHMNRMERNTYRRSRVSFM